MLETTHSDVLTPDAILAELKTARRVLTNLASSKDRRAVESYIADLNQQLGRRNSFS